MKKWNFERSSGYAGYRCQQCATWRSESQKLVCKCNVTESKSIQITITVPVVDRGNFDRVCDALENTSKEFSLQTLDRVFKGETVNTGNVEFQLIP